MSVHLGRWFDIGQQPQQFAQSGECTVPKVGSTIRLRWASEALRFTGGDLEAQFPAPSLSLSTGLISKLRVIDDRLDEIWAFIT